VNDQNYLLLTILAFFNSKNRAQEGEKERDQKRDERRRRPRPSSSGFSTFFSMSYADLERK